ncbi:MAG: hypothetical protein JJV89_02305 [Desulfosarcina sp.]|nr:hypothetical protein [Desulfobacterales bacterium]
MSYRVHIRSDAETDIEEAAVHRHTRRARIHRFPFGIYYRIEEESLVVVAVMHGSRHPKRWQQRTKPITSPDHQQLGGF